MDEGALQRRAPSAAAMMNSSDFPDSQHLVSAALEFIGYRDLCHLVSFSPEMRAYGSDMGRGGCSQLKQRKDPRFSTYPAQLGDCLNVESEIEMVAVEKKKMGTYGKIECAIRKAQTGNDLCEVSPVQSALRIVREEGLHRLHAHCAQVIDRANVLPYEFAGIRARFLHYRVKGLVDSVPDLVYAERIEGIHRDHCAPLLVQFGVEAGGTAAAIENALFQVIPRQREHGRVFGERPAPGNDVFQLKRHCFPFLSNSWAA